MSAEFLPPLPPPSCLQDLGRCAICPFVSPELPDADCAVRSFAVAQTQLNELTRGVVENSQQEIETLEQDDLLGILSPKGLANRIAKNPELQDELLANQWGVLVIDVRFLKYYNDKVSREKGDEFLIQVSEELTEIVSIASRQNQQPPSGQTERRQSNPTQEDILWRYGGDEFGLLVRGVDSNQLELVRQRFAGLLSVDAGIQRTKTNGEPMIASVGAAHAEDNDSFERFAALNMPEKRYAHCKRRLVELSLAADNAHQLEKTSQYEAMWQYLVTNNAVRSDSERPKDDRNIAEMFITHLQSAAG